MKIWRCLNCQTGVRAPEKLARDDVRRWCLRCSAKTGKLVERGVPSRETEKERRASARKEATSKRQARRAVAEAATVGRTDALATAYDRPREDAAAWLRAWAPRIAGLKSLREHHKEHHPGRLWKPEVQIRQGAGERLQVPRVEAEQYVRDLWTTKRRSAWIQDTGQGDTVTVAWGRFRASGHAYPWERRLVVTTGDKAADDLSTLVHELAHLAAPDREMHGPIFQLIQREAVQELTGETIEGWHRSGEEGRVAVIQRWLDSQKSKGVS